MRGARVLVTGADGFIGSHLVERLVRQGASVRAFTFYNSWNSIGWLEDIDAEISGEFEVFVGDIRDVERVASAVSQRDYIFHLSSLVGIPYSYEAPRSYFDTNVIGALNVFEACRRSDGVTRIVHTSTSEVYGSAQFVPITESHPLVGQSTYAASKIAADKVAESYYRSFDLPVTTARPFNTFGPRQTPRAVIATIASQLLDHCETLELGALAPTRDFNYVADTVAAFIEIANCDEAVGETVNFGSGEEWSIEETARMLMEITNHRPPINCDEARLRPEKSEVDRLLADTQKLKRLTGWERQVSFEEGLRLTVEWMEARASRDGSTHYSI